jgi:hypothetical protein
LARLFEGHVGNDVVSRAWQRTGSAWQAWQERDLAGEDIVRLILAHADRCPVPMEEEKSSNVGPRDRRTVAGSALPTP